MTGLIAAVIVLQCWLIWDVLGIRRALDAHARRDKALSYVIKSIFAQHRHPSSRARPDTDQEGPGFL